MIPHKTKHGAAALARLKAYEGELENKRKERAQLAYERKKQLNKLRVKAEKKPRRDLPFKTKMLLRIEN
ncbi:hypothetical protein Pyn_30642 [Prunus yedoensis var. nudiflora]|uniref:60S ribosomal protein L13a-4 n=1 Tax=Prunus yedoensis var. nudiflora TaxID=2094558 RepID=A0A314YV56_PRUYE|nr:hypothetical protein Pyn_30642 [Prunus yedoensis var. nudiflora]